MQLRAPSVPLITVDPYFSIWSPADTLTEVDTAHWTNTTTLTKQVNRPIVMLGTANIDGTTYRFMGANHSDPAIPAMKQVSLDIDALTTTYVFEAAGVRLTAKFFTPLFPNDLYLLSRPVSYLKLCAKSLDGAEHAVSYKVSVSEQVCLNGAGEDEVTVEELSLANGLNSIKMGSVKQPVLGRCGDDLRIDWGYFYLTASNAKTSTEKLAAKTLAGEDCEMTCVSAEVTGCCALYTFAYDDIKSIQYFEDQLTSYWNKDGAKITDEIVKAHGEYADLLTKATALSDDLFLNATRAGGEKYAELLLLAFRQVLNAHKLAVDKNGELLWISKECFSNGCAATVDVSYPSIPMFLIYNPELVRAMMRPIYKFAASDEWTFDFAPHDAGCYPFVTGQVYGVPRDGKRHEHPLHVQMPVEECGNMLVMEAATAVASDDVSFAASHIDTLKDWVKYLIKHGPDPENQLCTDDFAGHLAHNCNLSLKAIMGIAGLGIILNMMGEAAEAETYMQLARDMAIDWEKRAANGDGSYKLAFDREGTFSMKYNIVWDKLFGTGIMPKWMLENEFASYRHHIDAYGMPLDNRQPYTKSDWLVWTATLAEKRSDFEAYVAPLWNAYHKTQTRTPMTDWFWTVTAAEVGFQNRTVQGGLFIKLLEYKQIMKLS